MSTDLNWLQGRYVRELRSLYGSEMEQLNVLPDMAEAAQAPALRSAFRYHAEKTREHAERLKHICLRLNLTLIGLRRPAAEGPADDARRSSASEASAREDAILLEAAQRMERHEISSYLLALSCAQLLRDDVAVALLGRTLQEEYEAQQILAELDTEYSGRAAGKFGPGLAQPASLADEPPAAVFPVEALRNYRPG